MRSLGTNISRALSTDAGLLEGRLAQLVEHLVYTERVGGSIPSPPTIPDLVLALPNLSLPIFPNANEQLVPTVFG